MKYSCFLAWLWKIDDHEKKVLISRTHRFSMFCIFDGNDKAAMAWVVRKEGSWVTSEELVDYCKGRIATFKIPRYWKFVEEFPTTVTGKVRKVEMREISAKELGLHVRE